MKLGRVGLLRAITCTNFHFQCGLNNIHTRNVAVMVIVAIENVATPQDTVMFCNGSASHFVATLYHEIPPEHNAYP